MQIIRGFASGVNEEVTVAGKQAALLWLALLNQDGMDFNWTSWLNHPESPARGFVQSLSTARWPG